MRQTLSPLFLVVLSPFASALPGGAPPPGMAVLLTENGELSGVAVAESSANQPQSAEVGILPVAAAEPAVALPLGAETAKEWPNVRADAVSTPMPPPAQLPPLPDVTVPRVSTEAFALPPELRQHQTSASVPPAKVGRANGPLGDRTLLRADSAGVITVLPQRVSSGSTRPNPRNPWGIRVTTRDALLEYEIRLDGVVQGMQGGTAVISGAAVKTGDKPVGPFVVAQIERGRVVMEYDGNFFALREGERVRVRIPKR